jgi:site-specific DNA-methyltransferase (adenine-specific)
MLDSLEAAWAANHDGEVIWTNSQVRFLDPFTKSGVFLREIVSRLTDGLASELPDLQTRIDHILEFQIFGLGISRITGLLARRSVYCSKDANGKHSITKQFLDDEGNIRFVDTPHVWAGDRCGYCGANRSTLDRATELESHAYSFIHTTDIQTYMESIFGEGMRFDVIIGNPPYQLETESERRQAKPIYNLFIEQAKKLDPSFIVMVTPARWLVGGMGLGEFRSSMLSDGRLRELVDFIVERDAFPSINANGGICYFVWDALHQGKCTVTTVAPGGHRSVPVMRDLNEYDILVRRNEALPIVRKVLAKGFASFSDRVSSIGPFGLPTNFHGKDVASPDAPIKLYGSRRVSWVNRSEIPVHKEWIDEWKVLVPRATDGNEKYPLPIWDQVGPFIAAPNEACSWTYLIATLASSEDEADMFVTYMRTRLFRFLVSLRKITQDNKADNFSFVPDLPMDRHWTDAELFNYFELSEEEISHVEDMIRDMKFDND